MQHKIETIQDIFNVVNPDNIDTFLKDFEIILRHVVLVKSVNQKNGEKIINQQQPLNLNYFHWMDDGKNDFSFKVGKPSEEEYVEFVGKEN